MAYVYISDCLPQLVLWPLSACQIAYICVTNSFALIYLMAYYLHICGFTFMNLIADGLRLYAREFFIYFVIIVFLLPAVMPCYILL